MMRAGWGGEISYVNGMFSQGITFSIRSTMLSAAMATVGQATEPAIVSGLLLEDPVDHDQEQRAQHVVSAKLHNATESRAP